MGMKLEFVWGLGAIHCGAMLIAACGETKPAPVENFPEVTDPGPSHNRIVGYFTGGGTLPDGRELDVVWAAGKGGSYKAIVHLDGVGNYIADVPYDIGSGVLMMGTGVTVPIGDDTVIMGSVPKTSGWTQFDFRANGGSSMRVDVNLTKSHLPLGGDNVATVITPSTDCNAMTGPHTLASMVTHHDVHGAVPGRFTAQIATGMADSTQQIYFAVEDLTFADPEAPSEFGRVQFPNAHAQLSYSEPQRDGTVRQWSAVSGTVVYDALDASTVSKDGIEHDNGKVTFHLENVVMQPSNSTSDPRFVGAVGNFTLTFSGTSSVGYKRYST